MKNKVTLLDYLLAIPVAIYFWWAKHFDKSTKCKDNPHELSCYECQKQRHFRCEKLKK